MTVFIAHAPQDLAAAEALEKFLERRGLFVELEDGESPFRPLQFNDAVIALVSRESVFSPMRLRFDQRALEAWAEQKLIVVKLDHHFAPVGLRDLPAIDASFEAQREIAWAAVAKQVADIGRPAPPPAGAAPRAPSPPQAQERAAPSPKRARARGGGIGSAILYAVLILPGLAAFAVLASIWLANRIGPVPGTFEEALNGVNAFAFRFGAPGGVGAPAALALMTLSAAAMLFLLVRLIQARGNSPRKAAPEAQGAHDAPDEREAVFVSYARANAPLVLPVVNAVKKIGRKVWLDQEHLSAGESWAGEIVRAIRTADGVCVMCSPAAFESDHVKREVYLADRYKKRLLPVFIEEATPPEDFEYFFAGVQQLRLFEAPESERAALLSKALGA